MMPFATTKKPTPVFNSSTPHSFFGASLLLDDQHLLRCIETVLLPHTKIQLLQRVPETALWKIQTEEYPYEGDFYVDESFISTSQEEPPARTARLPHASTMISMANALIGSRYIWGGNWPLGIPSLPTLFPPQSSELSSLQRDTWQLKGVDCSGLLYFLSDGHTPRNTSKLVSFGETVPIEGLAISEMINRVRPLDLIVYKGHVVIIMDKDTAIESRAMAGVVKTPLSARLTELMQTKMSINDPIHCSSQHFVIRRWQKFN